MSKNAIYNKQFVSENNTQGCKSGFFIRGDNLSNFTKICNPTCLGGMIFQLSKNTLKIKRKLSNFQFHVPQQC